MALSHVLMWSDEYGYQPVTDDKAARVYPYTVPAKTKTFVCGICGQGITFTAGRERVRHFRHDRAEQNKECEERSQSCGYSFSAYSLPTKIRTLPLRLIRVPGRWRLEIGLLSLQKADSDRCAQKFLCIEDDKGNVYKYNLKERLQLNGLTWLDTGAHPSQSFRLYFNDGSSLPRLWPQLVDGIEDVTLFNAENGCRLPFLPDVQIGKEYIAIVKGRFTPDRIDVRAEFIRSNEHGWVGYDIYRVKAFNFSQWSASFFLRLKANLKKQMPIIFPMWPVVIRTPHLIYHDADELFIFLEGEGVNVQAFPFIPLTRIVDRETVRLIRFSCGIRKQLVSGDYDIPLLQLGRYSRTLRYDYFIRQPFDQTTSPPKVTVTDHKGNELKGDLLEGILPGTHLYVQGSFDGEVWLKSEDSPLPDRRMLKGGATLELKAGMGQTLSIFQGLDCVRTIVFVRPAQKEGSAEDGGSSKKDHVLGWTDAQLCRRLKRMTGDEVEDVRFLAECVRFFREWRSVGAWLKQKQIDGNISRKAHNLLWVIMEEGKR